MIGEHRFRAQVSEIRCEAQSIKSFDLRPLPGDTFKPFTPGAHIDLHLPNGLVRSYSLANPSSEIDRYVFAVNLDPASRGGSRYVHENIHVGEILECSGPRNNFPLNEAARHTVFIAGGIGITPILAMIYRLEQIKARWELYYATRTRQAAAFLEELARLSAGQGKVHLTFDQEPGGAMLDLPAIINEHAHDVHFYCCGPTGMIKAFESSATQRASSYIHVEYFAAKDAPATGGGYEVYLHQSGKSVYVRPGTTILEALMDAGVDVPSSCRQGACGTCETRVIEGIPDHRDVILTEEERAANQTMMICCSGSKSAKLVLDL